MSKLQVVQEIHRYARKNFPRRKFTMRGIADTLQADLIEMQPHKRENLGYRYILIAIDVFSKMAYTEPLKDKTGVEVTRAMERIIQKVMRQHARNRINNLQTDDGKEFFNQSMKRLMEKYRINHYSTFSAMKASIVERLIRTIKRKIYQQFSLRGRYKWIDIIDDLVDEYNNSKHRTIRMAPYDVSSRNEQRLLDTVYNYVRTIPFIKKNNKFKVGDHVRLSKYKHVFEKGYLPSWTTEVFKISKIQNTVPITYLLVDWEGNEIKGGVYAEEMQLVKYPDVYLVEKILRKRNGKVYVKWLGFDNRFNSWINENDVL